VESALLAQQGFHAPREILTTENGFFHAFAGNREAGHEAVVDLAKTYYMKDLLYKRYSVGGPNLAPLYAYFQLMNQHKFTGDDVMHIEVKGMRPNSDGMVDHHPSIHTETIMLLAACYGEYTFKHAHDPRYLTDPRFVAFQKRVRVTLVPREDITLAGRSWKLKAGMTVRTRDGSVYETEANHPLMTQSDIEQKFQELVGLRLDQARTMDLERKLKEVESIDNVAKLVRDLEIAY
jgi:2-methylcitrate dehydratase PrpD